MPRSPKNADGRVAVIRAMRAAHSAEARRAAVKMQAPTKPRDKAWDKKLEKLQAALEKKFKFRAFSTVASGSRAANLRAQPSGWQEIDDLITGETDESSKTIAGSGLGWPRGRIIEIYGKESVGKTSLALLIVRAFQRAGEEAAFIDAEHALDVTYAAKLGVDMTRLQLGQPDSAEETLQVVQEACDSGLFGVVVVDSVAALTPEAELEGDMGDAHVGLHARLMSQALRKLKGIVDRRNVLLVFINQTRCVFVDELVVTDRGIVRAGEVAPVSTIAGLHGGLVSVGGLQRSRQEMITLTCMDGRTLSAGLRHPVRMMSVDGTMLWVPVSELKIGDWVAVARSVELPDVNDSPLPSVSKSGREKIEPLPSLASEDFCTLLGMWFADGSMIDTEQCINFTEVSRERMEALLMQLSRLRFGHRRYGENGIGLRSQVYKLLDAIGCERGAANKTIPFCVTGRRQWRAFLRGMFDSHVTNHGLNMTFGNLDAAKKTQLALLGFGINSRLSTTRTKQLYISGHDAVRYVDSIGFVEETKREDLLRAVGVPDESARGKADVIPHPSSLIREARESRGWSSLSDETKKRISSVLSAGLCLSLRDYMMLVETCGTPRSISDHRWVKVRTIKRGPAVDMVDFDVPRGHAFIAGGLVTHNTKIGVMWGNRETTTGGNALKFYASVRLELVNVKTMKKGTRVSGRRIRIRAVKNKVAPPFREVFADFEPNIGIARVHADPDLGGASDDD